MRKRSANSAPIAVADLADVGEGAEVVIVCVFTDEQVAAGVPRERPALRHAARRRRSSSTRPEARAPPRPSPHAPGIDVLDAPVSGGPHNIAAGQVTLFVGGDDDAVARGSGQCWPPTRDPILHVGRTRCGPAVKLVNNTLFAAQIGLLAEAVAAGRPARRRRGRAARGDDARQRRAVARSAISSQRRASVEAFIDAVGEFIGKDVAVVRKIVAELGERPRRPRRRHQRRNPTMKQRRFYVLEWHLVRHTVDVTRYAASRNGCGR